ncbi:MAG: glycosyltransferase family 39 protein [Planctomycetes bacterium]|nr:glycosyltransferase family 39 protein [Planctomycetota bacterium]
MRARLWRAIAECETWILMPRGGVRIWILRWLAALLAGVAALDLVSLRAELAPISALALISLALLLWAEPLRRGLLRLERSNPAWVVAGLFVLTVVVRLAWGYEAGDAEGLRIKQLPYSDANNWMELSEDFARGARVNATWLAWGARRPLTYVINGSWLALVGTSTLAIVVLNVLCSGLSAGLIFDGLRRIAPFPIALLGGLVHAGSRLDAAYGTTMMSEPSGYFLSNVALWALAIAILGERRGEAPRGWYFLAGVALAVSNLSRPLTLLCAPAIPLLVLLVLSRRGLGKRGALSGAVRAGVFVALGAGICIGPWIVRQKVRHDILTISDNTAEMLFAASDPRYGLWTSEVSLEATRAGQHTWAERSAYYGRRFKENLRDHPGHYAEVIVRSAGGALVERMSEPWWWLLGLLLLGFWGSGSQRVSGEFLLYTGAALAVALAIASGVSAPRAWPWFLLGCLLALARAELMSLLVVSLCVTLFSIGIVAAPFARFTYSLEWLALALEVWAVWKLAAWARRGGAPPDLEELRASGAQPELVREFETQRGLGRALLLLLAALGVGFGIAVSRRVSPQVPAPAPALTRALSWRASALSQPEAADYAPISSALTVRRFLVLPTYMARFEAGESIRHHSGLFRSRAYDRTYFSTRPPVTAPAGRQMTFSHATFPARLDPVREEAVTALGVWVAAGPEVWGGNRFCLFEIVALSRDPQPEGATWRWGAPRDRAVHSRVLSQSAADGDLVGGDSP